MERRKVLGLLGGSMTVALAGCGGGGDDDNGNESNGNESNGNESNGNGDTGPALTDAFVATSQGGLLAIGEDSEESARENGFGLPPSEAVSEPIVVDGEISDTSWESTNVELPNLDPQTLLDQIGGGGDLPIDPEDLSIQLGVPDGFSGTLDQEEGLMTVEGDLNITVGLPGDDEIQITVTLTGTTAESGDLSGSIDLSSEPVTATVVDNQTTVDAIESESSQIIADVINSELGLPSGEGQTWLEIEFEIENASGNGGGNGGGNGNESS